MTHEIALRVLVLVEAESPAEAEREAWRRADELRASPTAIVTMEEFVRTVAPEEAHARARHRP